MHMHVLLFLCSLRVTALIHVHAWYTTIVFLGITVLNVLNGLGQKRLNDESFEDSTPSKQIKLGKKYT